MFAIIESVLVAIISVLSLAFVPGKTVSKVISAVLNIFVFHKVFYRVMGFFFTRKFKPAKNQHKYAVCIAARNEETVIGNLIDSIKCQDYPSELVTIFVVADNCTDSTAKLAREKGAVCYERFNDSERTKGFALKYLFENIEKDYGIESFEGYFIFDADNLLNSDYITRMNESFDAGEKIITSYRNTKNFDENWVASTYALHWLRSIRFNHRVRSFLHLATNIQGTGFLFANELVKDGWKYTSLTEDRAFTADAVAKGYKISYNDTAMFYDEQPTSLKIALRQRLRWSKGHLLAFKESGWALFTNIFLGNRFKNRRKGEKITKKDVLESIRHRWASFDTLAQLIPRPVIKYFTWIAVYVVLCTFYRFENGIDNELIFSADNWLANTVNFLFGDISINMRPGTRAALSSIIIVALKRVIAYASYDISNMLSAVYVFIVERKRIKKMKLYKKIFYCITFPIFDVIHRITMYIAVFAKVTWKPIPHTSKVTIQDLEGVDNTISDAADVSASSADEEKIEINQL